MDLLRINASNIHDKLNL